MRCLGQMHQKLLISVPLLLVLTGSSAIASPIMARSPYPEKPKDRSTEVQVGMLIGGADVGDVTGSGVGMQLSLGRRYGEWTVSGEFNYMGISHRNDVEPEGTMSRVSMLGRLNVLEFGGGRTPIMGRLWMEGGLGVQRVAWDAGGILTRPDIAFGFGFSWAGILNRKEPKKKKTIGWFVAFRAHFAQAPKSTSAGAPMCAGPCDRATGPSRNDVSMFANFGFHWGRY